MQLEYLVGVGRVSRLQQTVRPVLLVRVRIRNRGRGRGESGVRVRGRGESGVRVRGRVS